MLPSTSPEAAAASAVLINGGFDPFQYVQLPDGYTAAASGASKAYRMFNGSYTWADARQACEADGAQIAMPKTVTDMRDILGRNGKRISRREVIGVHNSFYSHRPLFTEYQDTIWEGAILRQGQNASGNGYFLDFVGSSGEWIEWRVPSDSAGPGNITFVYASTTNRPLELKVNGLILESSLDFTPTSSWSDWQELEIEVPLVVGDNSVRITTIGNSGGNFNALIVGGTSHQPGTGGQSSMKFSLNWYR